MRTLSTLRWSLQFFIYASIKFKTLFLLSLINPACTVNFFITRKQSFALFLLNYTEYSGSSKWIKKKVKVASTTIQHASVHFAGSTAYVWGERKFVQFLSLNSFSSLLDLFAAFFSSSHRLSARCFNSRMGFTIDIMLLRELSVLRERESQSLSSREPVERELKISKSAIMRWV